MRDPTSTVAIDTVPLPESPVRLELFFLDHLFDIAAITAEADIDLRTRLSMLAIGTWPTPEYPERELAEMIAGGIIVDGRQLVIDSLEANGHIPHNSHRRWMVAVESSTLGECLPGLMEDVDADNWTHSSTIEVLATTFAATMGMGLFIEGSPMDEYCRLHPNDPKCHVMTSGIGSQMARRMVQDLLIVHELHSRDMLTTDQTRAILGTFFVGIKPMRRWTDLSMRSARMILDALDLNAVQRNTIRRGLAPTGVGRFGPDSPWAEICSSSNPPRICRYLGAFPVASALTLGLIRSKVWETEDAFRAWDSIVETEFPR